MKFPIDVALPAMPLAHMKQTVCARQSVAQVHIHSTCVKYNVLLGCACANGFVRQFVGGPCISRSRCNISKNVQSVQSKPNALQRIARDRMRCSLRVAALVLLHASRMQILRLAHFRLARYRMSSSEQQKDSVSSAAPVAMVMCSIDQMDRVFLLRTAPRRARQQAQR